MSANASISKASKTVGLHAKRTAIYGLVAMTVVSAFSTGETGQRINAIVVEGAAAPTAGAIGALIGDVVSQIPAPGEGDDQAPVAAAVAVTP